MLDWIGCCGDGVKDGVTVEEIVNMFVLVGAVFLSSPDKFTSVLGSQWSTATGISTLDSLDCAGEVCISRLLEKYSLRSQCKAGMYCTPGVQAALNFH